MSTPTEAVHDAEVVAPETKSKAIARRRTSTIAKAEPPPPRASIEDMIMRALEMDKPELIDKFVAIFEKQEEERKKAALFNALSAFQAECPVIKKNKVVMNKDGRSARYRYADLGQIVRQVAPILAAHGLSYDFSATVQPFTEETGGPYMIVACNVHHREGYTHSFPFQSIIENNDFMNATQHAGSANMYAKRYAFCNAFGILTGDEDDDGNTAGRMTPQEGREEKARRGVVTQPRERPTASQSDEIRPFEERPQLEPAGEGEATIDKARAKGYTKAITHAFKGYGETAWDIGWGEFRKRFPAIERLGQIKDTAADQKIVLDWIADPTRN